MKKICTYLTLFVLAFFGLAQHASAAFDTTKDYYIYPKECTWVFDANAYFKIWDGSNNVDVTIITSDSNSGAAGAKVLKFKPTTTNGADGKLYLKRCQPNTENLWNELTISSIPSSSDNNLLTITSCQDISNSSNKNVSGTWSQYITITEIEYTFYLELPSGWKEPPYMNQWGFGLTGGFLKMEKVEGTEKVYSCTITATKAIGTETDQGIQFVDQNTWNDNANMNISSNIKNGYIYSKSGSGFTAKEYKAEEWMAEREYTWYFDYTDNAWTEAVSQVKIGNDWTNAATTNTANGKTTYTWTGETAPTEVRFQAKDAEDKDAWFGVTSFEAGKTYTFRNQYSWEYKKTDNCYWELSGITSYYRAKESTEFVLAQKDSDGKFHCVSNVDIEEIRFSYGDDTATFQYSDGGSYFVNNIYTYKFNKANNDWENLASTYNTAKNPEFVAPHASSNSVDVYTYTVHSMDAPAKVKFTGTYEGEAVEYVADFKNNETYSYRTNIEVYIIGANGNWDTPEKMTPVKGTSEWTYSVTPADANSYREFLLSRTNNMDEFYTAGNSYNPGLNENVKYTIGVNKATVEYEAASKNNCNFVTPKGQIGLIHFDHASNQIWWEKTGELHAKPNYDLYIMGWAVSEKWDVESVKMTWNAEEGYFEFGDWKNGYDYMISSAADAKTNNQYNAYYPSLPANNDSKYMPPFGKPETSNLGYQSNKYEGHRFTNGGNLAKVCVDPEAKMIWLEGDETFTDMYIKGEGITGNEPRFMVNNEDGTYYFVSKTLKAEVFQIAKDKNFNNVISAASSEQQLGGADNPTKITDANNSAKHSFKTGDFNGTIWFDSNTMEIWFERDADTYGCAFDRNRCAWTDITAEFEIDGNWISSATNAIRQQTVSGNLIIFRSVEPVHRPTAVRFSGKNAKGTKETTEEYTYINNGTYRHECFALSTSGDAALWCYNISQTNAFKIESNANNAYYNFDVKAGDRFYITKSKESDWWTEDHCFRPIENKDYTVPGERQHSNTYNVMLAATSGKTAFVAQYDGTIYFIPNSDGNGGRIWAKYDQPAEEAKPNKGTWKIKGTFTTEDWSDFDLWQTTDANHWTGIIENVANASGEFLLYTGNSYFTNTANTLSTNASVTLTAKTTTTEGGNTKYSGLTAGKSYRVNMEISGNNRIVSIVEYTAPAVVPEYSAEGSWEAYNFDLYLRGVGIFGVWDQPANGESSHLTAKMEKVDDQPGLYRYTIVNVSDKGYTNDSGNSETGHFMFSKSGTGMGDEFWAQANGFMPDNSSNFAVISQTPQNFKAKTSGDQGLNFALDQAGVLYVNMADNTAWLEPFEAVSNNIVYFDFLDKSSHNWWQSSSNVKCQLVNEAGDVYVLPYAETKARYTLNETSGTRYGAKTNLPEKMSEFLTEDAEGNAVINADYKIWVVISKGESETLLIKRPYVPGATYTQDDTNGNEYYDNAYLLNRGLMLNLEESLTKMELTTPHLPGANHKGGHPAAEVKYNHVNVFTAPVTTGIYNNSRDGIDSDAPEALKAIFGESAKAAYLTEKGRTTTVKDFNGAGTFTGIDFTADASTINLRAVYTYKASGMEVDLSATWSPEKSASNQFDIVPDEGTFGLKLFYGDASTADEAFKNHKAIDGIFSLQGTANLGEDKAAYIGYDIDPVDHGQHEIGSIHENNRDVFAGVPLTWDVTESGIFTDGSKPEAHDPATWHELKDGEFNLHVQVHHLAHSHSGSKDGSQGAEQAANVEGLAHYYIYMPVGTDVEYNPSARTNAPMKQVAQNKYSGTVSVRTVNSFSHDFAEEPGNISTGVEEVDVENADAPVEYYNLQGMRMNADTLAPGIYIRRQGQTTEKVYIR